MLKGQYDEETYDNRYLSGGNSSDKTIKTECNTSNTDFSNGNDDVLSIVRNALGSESTSSMPSDINNTQEILNRHIPKPKFSVVRTISRPSSRKIIQRARSNQDRQVNNFNDNSSQSVIMKDPVQVSALVKGLVEFVNQDNVQPPSLPTTQREHRLKEKKRKPGRIRRSTRIVDRSKSKRARIQKKLHQLSNLDHALDSSSDSYDTYESDSSSEGTSSNLSDRYRFSAKVNETGRYHRPVSAIYEGNRYNFEKLNDAVHDSDLEFIAEDDEEIEVESEEDVEEEIDVPKLKIRKKSKRRGQLELPSRNDSSDDENAFQPSPNEMCDVQCVCPKKLVKGERWVRCANALCETWQHATCVGYDPTIKEIPTDYLCTFCDPEAFRKRLKIAFDKDRSKNRNKQKKSKTEKSSTIHRKVEDQKDKLEVDNHVSPLSIKPKPRDTKLVDKLGSSLMLSPSPESSPSDSHCSSPNSNSSFAFSIQSLSKIGEIIEVDWEDNRFLELKHASLRGGYDCLDTLLENAFQDCSTEEHCKKRNILHDAVLSQSHIAVIMIFDYDSNDLISQYDVNGYTPFHYMLQEKKLAFTTLELLDRKESLSSTVDMNKNSSMHLVAKGGSVIVARRLYDIDEDSIHAVNNEDLTPLMTACIHGNYHVVEFLLKCGGSSIVSARDQSGKNAFLHAACCGHIDIMRLLLKHDPSLISSMEKTRKAGPLHCAVMGNHQDSIDYLINQMKCSVLKTDQYGWMPILYVDLRTNVSSLLVYLLKHNTNEQLHNLYRLVNRTRASVRKVEEIWKQLVRSYDGYVILNEYFMNHSTSLIQRGCRFLLESPMYLNFTNKLWVFNHYVDKLMKQNTEEVNKAVIPKDSTAWIRFRSWLSMHSIHALSYPLAISFKDKPRVVKESITLEAIHTIVNSLIDGPEPLFKHVEDQRIIWPCWSQDTHLDYYRLVGRFFAHILMYGHGKVCPRLNFGSGFASLIMEAGTDMTIVDTQFTTSLRELLQIEGIYDLGLYFVLNNPFKREETIELKKNGKNILVTDENKHEFVKLALAARYQWYGQRQASKFRLGMKDVLPQDLPFFKLFTVNELSLLLFGTTPIDLQQWKETTKYFGFRSIEDVEIEWFWTIVESLTSIEQLMLLQCVTGYSVVSQYPQKNILPVNELMGPRKNVSLSYNFQLMKDNGRNFPYAKVSNPLNQSPLPKVFHCFNTLVIPCYDTLQDMKEGLLTLIQMMR